MDNIYNIIEYEYQQRKDYIKKELMQKRLELFSEIPELEKVEEKIYKTGIEYSKRILSGKSDENDTRAEAILSKLNNLKEQKQNLLLQHGIRSDYLEPKYECSMCNDTGYVNKNGRLVRCKCYMQKLINYSTDKSNINLIDYENFDTFDENLYSNSINFDKYGIKISPRQNIKKIIEICRHFIDNFDSPSEKNLFFSGPAGVGKTFICSCIARELLNRGVSVLYQTAPVLFNTIARYRTVNFGNKNFEESNFTNIFNSQLLIIDDLGTESRTDSRYSEFLTILNQRTLTGLKKPSKMIISTNTGVKELNEYYDERITSRIIGNFKLLKFAGDDLRIEKYDSKSE
jgi:DNA replication protein DnaC